MTFTGTKMIVATAVAVCLAGTGLTVITFRGAGGGSSNVAVAAAAPASPEEQAYHLVAVPSPGEGILAVVGTELKEGQTVSPELLTTWGSDGEAKKYVKLRKGDRVKRGQVIARLDENTARTDYEIAKAKVAVSEADLAASKMTCEKAQVRADRQDKLWRTNATSKEDLAAARATVQQCQAEIIGKEQAVKIAKLGLRNAETVLKQHVIRAPVDGVIRSIKKHAGEAVKQYETIVEIAASDGK